MVLHNGENRVATRTEMDPVFTWDWTDTCKHKTGCFVLLVLRKFCTSSSKVKLLILTHEWKVSWEKRLIHG